VTSVHFLRFGHLGGLNVLKGAASFWGQRDKNIGKFMMMIGAGHGLLTVMFCIVHEFGQVGFSLDNNYIILLTSTATGLGMIFAVLLLIT
jgi:hypothetical protein